MPKQKNILNNFQKSALKELGKSELAKHFYWSGGTALAYGYLQHRFSEDLDFMSQELLPEDYLFQLVKNLSGNLKIKKIEQKKIYNRGEFIFYKNNQSLKLEFVYYPFKNYKKTRLLKEFNVRISSLEDIAINKIHALYERSEPKDIFDLYWILAKSKLNLKFLIKGVEKKFGVEIDLALFIVKTINTIEKLDGIQPLIFKKFLCQKEKMRKYFQNEANRYLKKYIK